MRGQARGWWVAAALSCGLGVFAGCGSKAVDEAMSELRARHSPPVDPFGTDAVAQAARQLEQRLGVPVRAFDVEIGTHRIVFSVQDPSKPGNVDAYELKNGVLMPPRPVQLMLMGDPLEPKLYPLAEVPLARIPELAKAALAALELEDGKVMSMTVHRKFSGIPKEMQEALDRAHKSAGIEDKPDPKAIPDGGLAVEIYVDSPRRKAYVLADGDFEIVRTSVL
jgi:hypothetical protein